jgi:integration host factor subunit beta
MKMNKSNLVIKISRKLAHFKRADVEEATDQLTGFISNTLSRNDRVEIRGFGTFSTRKRGARLARNPKTGSSIAVNSKFHPYFRASKLLRQLVNN